MERAVEIFAAVQCVVAGLSHMRQAHSWVEFFIWLRGKKHTGVFVNGMLSLTLGSTIVGFHNVWQGLPAVLTVFGWVQVLKGLLCLVAPERNLRSLNRVSHDRAHEFVIGGALFLVLGALFGYMAATHA